MSREIIYDKQFIKLAENKFIPFIYTGSNNCYEWNNRRRARNWVPLQVKEGGVVCSREDLMAYVDSMVDSHVSDEDSKEMVEESLFYYIGWEIGSKSSAKDLKNFFNTGCDKAITLEQLKELGCRVEIEGGYYNEKYRYETVECRVVAEPNFFLSDYKEIKNLEGVKNILVRLTGNLHPDYIAKGARSLFFPRKKREKERLDVDEFYTITVNGDYFVRNTARGYKWSHYPKKKYPTKKKAEQAIKRLKKHGRWAYEIKKIEAPTTILV
jgi:hypothetical protein